MRLQPDASHAPECKRARSRQSAKYKIAKIKCANAGSLREAHNGAWSACSVCQAYMCSFILHQFSKLFSYK